METIASSAGVIMPRREFPRKVRAAIILRATGSDGQIACEGCGQVLGKKPFEIDHTVAEELATDKSRKLTADDGKLLGWCCHGPKTAEDIRRVRKSDRARDKNTGAIRPKGNLKSRGFDHKERPDKLPPPPRRNIYRSA